MCENSSSTYSRLLQEYARAHDLHHSWLHSARIAKTAKVLCQTQVNAHHHHQDICACEIGSYNFTSSSGGGRQLSKQS